MNLYTYPDGQVILDQISKTPDYMYPNNQPYAFIFEGGLDQDECHRIVFEQNKLDAYQFPHCDALTTECAYPLSEDLLPIREILEFANKVAFKYDIDLESTRAWMQTYKIGGSYQRHMDGAPGQCRKLTAVAQLSHPEYYDGGSLEFDIPLHDRVAVPRELGTVVVFPGWMSHYVTPLTKGSRKTINMGVWGPAWK